MRCGELTPSARKAMPFASLKEARDDVLGKAKAGHPFCQYMIGNTYYFGDCFEIDGIDPQTAFHDPDGLRADTARRALPWLEKALNGGLSDAAKNLYNLFSGSEGFPRDRGRQWEIALRGASAGNPYWEERCGKMCREENGREAEAMRWFRQAAHHGQASSWFHIGSHYERGLGVDERSGQGRRSLPERRGKRVLRRTAGAGHHGRFRAGRAAGPRPSRLLAASGR